MSPPLREETTVSDILEQGQPPIEQATVSFYGRDIIAVRLADGRIAAVFSALCDAVQLERKSQTDRIREDEILSEQLLLVQIETPGGPQAVNVLTAWAIPTWLQGVRLSRVAPEKRPAILAFKREAPTRSTGTSRAIPSSPRLRPSFPRSRSPRRRRRHTSPAIATSQRRAGRRSRRGSRHGWTRLRSGAGGEESHGAA